MKTQEPSKPDKEEKESDKLIYTNREKLDCVIIQELPLLSSGNLQGKRVSIWHKMKETLHKIVDELLAPPTIGAVMFS